MSVTVWEGVFETFHDAKGRYPEKTNTDIFTSRRWRDSALAKTIKIQKVAANRGASSLADKSPLSLLASQVAKERGRVRILDFGGGTGTSVPQTFAALPVGVEAEITIVDNAELCAEGRALFSGDKRVIFTDTLPENQPDYDIVHCDSSLQYVDDWRQLLGKLTGYKANYILVCELLAGKIPSFVSLQNYYEDLVPVRFWNICEFVAALEELGYDLSLKTEYFPTIRGVCGPLPMNNFAEEYRLEQCCNVLFSNLDMGCGSNS